MKRTAMLIGILAAALMMNAAVIAQDDGLTFCATLTGRADVFPNVSGSLGLNLSLSFAGLSVTSETDLDVFPTMVSTESFEVKYTLSVFTVGSNVNFDIVPFSFQTWKAYVKLDFPWKLWGNEVVMSSSGYWRADATILPTFSPTSTLYVRVYVGPLSAWSKSIVDIIPFSFQTQRFGFSIDDFIGFTSDLIPLFNPNAWLTFSLSLGDLRIRSYTNLHLIPTVSGRETFTLIYYLDMVTLTSDTSFDIPAFAFSSEYIKANISYEGFSFYAWGRFTTSGPSPGIGFSYRFCTQ